MGWRVQHNDQGPGQREDWTIYDPVGILRFTVWEPIAQSTFESARPAILFVHPQDGLGCYVKDDGSAFRSGELCGSPGELGWLLDLLREQTGLPWVAGEGVTP